MKKKTNDKKVKNQNSLWAFINFPEYLQVFIISPTDHADETEKQGLNIPLLKYYVQLVERVEKDHLGK